MMKRGLLCLLGACDFHGFLEVHIGSWSIGVATRN